jgi:D-glycero-D-manno-heptose 1,7-bisphosphate phosphatase
VRPGVVVDRDGTLVDFHRDVELGVVTPAFHPSQLRFLPGAVEGLSLLARAGWPIAIATNQPGAAKGEISREAIERTNAALVARLAEAGVPVGLVAVCLHHPVGGPGGDPALAALCDCRKPLPGLLLRARDALDLDPSASWMVGDTAADLGAARAAGFRAALLTRAARCELCPLVGAPVGTTPDRVASRLDELASALLSEETSPT